MEGMRYFRNTMNPYYLCKLASYYGTRGDINTGLGLTKDAQKNYAKALKYMETAIQTCSRLDDMNQLAVCYERMGMVNRQFTRK